MDNAHYTLHNTQFKVNNSQITMQVAQFTVISSQCTMINSQCTMQIHTPHFTKYLRDGTSWGFSIVGGAEPGSDRSPEPVHVLFVVPESPAAKVTMTVHVLFVVPESPAAKVTMTVYVLFMVHHTLSIWLKMEFTSDIFLKTSVCADYSQTIFKNK